MRLALVLLLAMLALPAAGAQLDVLDDLVVLVAALKTLEATGLTTRYARWSNAIGGVALLVIGALLIFWPEWLAFA